MKINLLTPYIKINNSYQINNQRIFLGFGTNVYEAPRDAFVKSEKSPQKEPYVEEMRILTDCGLSPFRAKKFVDKGDKALERILTAIKQDAKPSEFPLIINLSDEQFEKYIAIRKECGEGTFALEFAYSDDEIFKKATQLLKCGATCSNASHLSRYRDDSYDEILNIVMSTNAGVANQLTDKATIARYKKMLDMGVPLGEIQMANHYNKSDFARIFDFLNYSHDTKRLLWSILNAGEKRYEKLHEYFEQGLDPHEADRICMTFSLEDAFQKLKEKYDNRKASVLACLPSYYADEFDEISKLIETISLNPKKQTGALSEQIAEILYDGVEIKALNDYIQNFNSEELFELAPVLKEYSPNDLLRFYLHHYKEQNDILNSDNLILPDFENHLLGGLVEPLELTEILTLYPLTNRQIGSIPKDWLDDIENPDKVAIAKKIDEIILKFNKTKNEEEFCEKMTSLLNKKTTITRLPSGQYGKCYKIAIEGAVDTCLKLFKEKHTSDCHGASFEPQAAFFANKYSDKFVKMFFARVAPLQEYNAYMVTQYLDKDTKPIETGGSFDYFVSCSDIGFDHNKIKDKIIDFGSIEVKKNQARFVPVYKRI